LTTGLSTAPEELRVAGERIYTLERAMLAGDGLAREDDTLPRRYFEEPVGEGPAMGSVIDAQEFQRMLDEYYRFHGWNRQGIPTKKTLVKLGIE
jgi:aldehyde:ferredoxin oxidoreductase